MRLFGLLGKSLKHSFSKVYFTQKFEKEQFQDCRYENFELSSIDSLPQLLAQYPELCGLNVTIPYKEDVLRFLAGQNSVVQKIKACNCIRITEGRLYGFNTDVPGFKQSLQRKLKPYHQKALILGTGGAAKAVQYALDLLGISYSNISRAKSTAAISYEEVNEKVIQDHQLIINTSPVGMYPHVHEAPRIPYQYLTPKHFLFDLVYNPEKTLFLKYGEEQGAAISNGYEMLVLQAEESWKIWNAESVDQLIG